MPGGSRTGDSVVVGAGVRGGAVEHAGSAAMAMTAITSLGHLTTAILATPRYFKCSPKNATTSRIASAHAVASPPVVAPRPLGELPLILVAT